MPHPAIAGHYEPPPAQYEPIRAQRPESRRELRPRYGERTDYLLQQFAVSTSPAARPTQAQPGTEGKIRVLRQRYKAQLPLWHPGDFAGRSEGGVMGAAGFDGDESEDLDDLDDDFGDGLDDDSDDESDSDDNE